MTQSFYSSVTGMTTGQTKLDVVANNIANMNTTAFKSSNLTFSDLYSRTLSIGSGPSTGVGGTNPMQVGLGVAVAGISKDFTSGSIETTGNINDLNIQGNGWFTVKNSDGSLGLTRDGSFSLDMNGNLVTQSGLKVIGTQSALSSAGSDTTVYVPTKLNLTTTGKDLTVGTAGLLENLNNVTISTGTITFDVYSTTGEKIAGIEVDMSDATSLQNISAAINDVIKANDKLTKDGASTIDATVNSDGTFSINTYSVEGLESVAAIDFSTTGDTSNFLYETGLASARMDESGSYNSKILSYQADISPATSGENTVSKASYAVTASGALEVTYSNGDTISVANNNSVIELKYTTSDGKTISARDINVTGNAITPANLQIQMASVLNEQGLLSAVGNVYTTGPNCGEVTYSIGNSNGFGEIGSGGLEASNVNLAIELSNMILAQRGIDANSRVFSTTSDVLERLVNMG